MTVSLRDDTGNLLGGSQILPGGLGHTAFYTNLLFPLTANRRGTGKVLSPSGKLHDEVAKSREVGYPDKCPRKPE